MSDYNEFEQDEEAGEAVDPLKRKMHQLAVARQERDAAKLAEKRAEEAYRALEAEIIAMIEDSGLKGKITFDFGGDLGTISFQRKSTVYGKILDLNEALEAFENEAIIDEITNPKVEARRLNEYVRTKFENGEDLPQGVGFVERKFVSISGMGG